MPTIEGLRVALDLKLSTSTKRREVMHSDTAKYTKRYVESFLSGLSAPDLLSSLTLRNCLRSWLHQQRLARSTQQLAAMVVSSFLYEEQAITAADRKYILGRFRAETADWSEKALSADELERILAELSGRGAGLTALRDLYVTVLMTTLGLRISQALEIPALAAGLYKGERGEELRMNVGSKKSAFNKAGITRRVLPAGLRLAGCPYSAGELHALYVSVRPAGAKVLIANRSGEPVSDAYFRGLYQEVGHKLHIHLHPHRFRHTCGTAVTRAAGIAQAAAILGHASVNTTQRYVDRSQFDYAAIIEQSFPFTGKEA